MPVYIQAAQAISPQDTFHGSSRLTGGFSKIEFQPLPGPGFYNCMHPDYKQFFDPVALRRMSPVIRMGLAASKVCMEEAGIEKPDAILVGTGLGCVRDTAKFLKQVIENGELLLNPTAFIQSTHNTVSGQIALMLACRAYNLTFSQNSLSFETALLEGMMLLGEGEASHILLGGIDEVVEESYQLMKQNGCVNSPMGEGSNFFVISSQGSHKSLARIDGLELMNRACKPGEIAGLTSNFLASRGLSTGDVDLFISGRNGDDRFDGIYSQVEQVFPAGKMVTYKHLAGEYDTASAFGMWLGTKIIQHNYIPGAARIPLYDSRPADQSDLGDLPAKQDKAPIRHVLLFNQLKGRDFCWTLLSHPES